MSEHDEMRSDLRRIETKLDLLMQAVTKTHSIEFHMTCDDDYHRKSTWGQAKCPSCGDWEPRPHLSMSSSVEPI